MDICGQFIGIIVSIFMMESQGKLLIKILLSLVFAGASSGQNTPSIGFISPDVITDIGITRQIRH